MTGLATGTWLAQWQARFGAVLRTPLSAQGGVLRPAPSDYAPDAVADILPSSRLSAAQRLAVYQRQYWIRLLHTLQEQYPMTTRLLGAWFFNQHAVAFLLAHPPRSHDLGDVVDGFDTFLAETFAPDEAPRGPRLPRLALIEASRLDAAYRRVFLAPEQPKLALQLQTDDDLLSCSLTLSPTCALVEEHWPLARLRLRTMREPGERAVALPEPWPAPRHGVVHRTPHGVAYRPLAQLQVRLLELLAHQPVGHALGVVETECSPDARARLPELARELLESGVRLGFFSGPRNV